MTSFKAAMPLAFALFAVLCTGISAHHMVMTQKQCSASCGDYSMAINVNPSEMSKSKGAAVVVQDESYSVFWDEENVNKTFVQEFNATSDDGLTLYQFELRVKATPIIPEPTQQEVTVYTFIMWINWELRGICSTNGLTPITHITDLTDGKYILYLMRQIFISETKITVTHSAKDNFNVIFDILRRYELLKPTELTLDFESETSILVVLQLIRTYKIQLTQNGLSDILIHPNAQVQPDFLLWWAQQVIMVQGVRIADFTPASWSNGLAFCGLLAKVPTFDYELVIKMTVEERLTYVFTFIEKRFNIPQLLKPCDMQRDVVDQEFIILYITYIYQQMPHDKPTFAAIGLPVDERKEEFKLKITTKLSVYKLFYAEISKMPTLPEFECTIYDILNAVKLVQQWMTTFQSYQVEMNQITTEIVTYYSGGQIQTVVNQQLTHCNAEFKSNYDLFYAAYLDFQQRVYQKVITITNNEIITLTSIFERLIDVEQKTIVGFCRNVEYVTSELLKINVDIDMVDASFTKKVNEFISKMDVDHNVASRTDLKQMLNTVTMTFTDIKEKYNEVSFKLNEWNKQLVAKEVLKNVTVIQLQVENLVKYECTVNPSDVDAMQEIIHDLKEHKQNLLSIQTQRRKEMADGACVLSNENHNKLMNFINKILNNITPNIQPIENDITTVMQLVAEIQNFTDNVETVYQMSLAAKDVTAYVPDLYEESITLLSQYQSLQKTTEFCNYIIIDCISGAWKTVNTKWQYILTHQKPPRTFEEIRIDAYIGWVNWKISSNFGNRFIAKFSELFDGKRLRVLANLIFKNNTGVQADCSLTENIEEIHKLFSDHNMDFKVDMQGLLSKKSEAFIGLLDVLRDARIEQQLEFVKKVALPAGQKGSEILLTWCKKSVSSETIVNFGKSWVDGKAFSILLAKHSDFQYNITDSMTDKERLERVFKFVNDHLHIPQLFSADDLIIGRVDKELVKMYISFIFEATNGDRLDKIVSVGVPIALWDLDALSKNVDIWVHQYKTDVIYVSGNLSKIESLNKINDISDYGKWLLEMKSKLEENRNKLISTQTNYKNKGHEYYLYKEKLAQWETEFNLYQKKMNMELENFKTKIIAAVQAAIKIEDEFVAEIQRKLNHLSEMELKTMENLQEFKTEFLDIKSKFSKVSRVPYFVKSIRNFIENYGEHLSTQMEALNKVILNIENVHNNVETLYYELDNPTTSTLIFDLALPLKKIKSFSKIEVNPSDESQVQEQIKKLEINSKDLYGISEKLKGFYTTDKRLKVLYKTIAAEEVEVKGAIRKELDNLKIRRNNLAVIIKNLNELDIISSRALTDLNSNTQNAQGVDPIAFSNLSAETWNQIKNLNKMCLEQGYKINNKIMTVGNRINSTLHEIYKKAAPPQVQVSLEGWNKINRQYLLKIKVNGSPLPAISLKKNGEIVSVDCQPAKTGCEAVISSRNDENLENYTIEATNMWRKYSSSFSVNSKRESWMGIVRTKEYSFVLNGAVFKNKNSAIVMPAVGSANYGVQQFVTGQMFGNTLTVSAQFQWNIGVKINNH